MENIELESKTNRALELINDGGFISTTILHDFSISLKPKNQNFNTYNMKNEKNRR